MPWQRFPVFVSVDFCMVIVAVGSLDEYRGGEEPVVYIYQLDVELRDVRSVIAVVDKARGEKKRPV